MPRMARPHCDTYSIPREHLDLWEWLSALTINTQLPKVLTAWDQDLPLIRRAAEQPPRRRGPGRPRRAEERAREVALAYDIDAVRPIADEQRRDKRGLLHDYDGGRLGVPGRVHVITHMLDTYGSRTIERWRDDGRRSWADLGAWPWALTPHGKLSRVWWRKPEYADALRRWATEGIWMT
jgi:hypothetical protein